MSDEININDDFGGDDMLAAELSLGLLSGDALSSAQRRARIDQPFGALVEDWDIRLSTFCEDVAPVEPPNGLFKKITSDAYGDSPKRLWQQLSILPAFFGAAAAALVLILAIQFGGIMQSNGPVPTLVVEMAAEDQSIVVAAAYVEDSASLFVEWQVGARLPGRDVELWLIAGQGAPVSFGVLNKGQPITEFVVPAQLQSILAGASLAVSDEPLGGSPTGAPTGEILAIGEITTL